MTANDEKEELYQVFFDGDDFCAELIDGSWRVVVLESGPFHSGKEFDQKPDRFVKYELLTVKEIFDRDLHELLIADYDPGSILEGTTTILEAINRLMDEAKYLVSLMDKGCYWEEDTEEGFISVCYYLKPYQPNEKHNQN